MLKSGIHQKLSRREENLRRKEVVQVWHEVKTAKEIADEFNIPKGVVYAIGRRLHLAFFNGYAKTWAR